MWSPGAITLSILFVCGLEAAPLFTCPKSCTCIGTELYCNSFSILSKLSDNQASAVTKLVINNSSSPTNPKLNNLQNLRILNLASNKIKQLNTLYLPKSVEYLDLSNNFITTLPQDFHTLKELKELRLTGNPISCTCDSISVRDQLLKNNVIIATPVKCHSPENLQGKSWLVESHLDLLCEMQGDSPYEGSGFEDAITGSDVENNLDKSLEEEFIRIDTTTKIANTAVTTPKATEEVEEEGSGNSDTDSTTPLIEIDTDEDGIEDTPISESPSVRVNDLLLNNVKACNFDCSTPAPPENDTDALPPPGVFEGAKIVWEDFGVLKGDEPTNTSVVTTTVKPSIAENGLNDTIHSDAETLTELPINANGSTTKAKESKTSTYIFLGAVLLVIIVIAIYAVIKKRQLKKASLSPNSVNEKPAVNEVELIKSTKPNGIQEAAPLMNGHGDKDIQPFEDVELRQKPNDADGENTALLVPETKRVTIKASEIPNSTPKSPVLVTRHLNSDGIIVTTPTIHQKV